MDYIIIFPGIPSDFQDNEINLVLEKQILLEKSYFQGLELVSDSTRSSDESE